MMATQASVPQFHAANPVQLATEAGRPFNDGDEFTHLRYTMVDVKNPTHFKDRFSLLCNRPSMNAPRHKVDIFIVITMYAEAPSELQSTLLGVLKNVRELCRVEDSNAWQKVCVCVVSDGRVKANKATLEYAQNTLGIYEDSIVQKTVDIGLRDLLNPSVHLFERSVQVKDEGNRDFFPPLQMIFALKEHNAGKLDSHKWFFDGFAEAILPKYTVLLDVGTAPEPRAVYKLYRAMERDSQIAGVCGEITADASFKQLFNPVIAAQVFEYKVANLMDKALESVFGFISVLPGAFSAYRYEAIRGGPMREYFKGIEDAVKGKELSPFKGNMYLAEDRILCFALVARENCSWTLHYVKNAVAKTDVPTSVPDLVKQRRRWNNGAFFAMLYSITHFGQFWSRSAHSVGRKLAISVLFGYYLLSMLLGWFLVGTFYLTFYFLVKGTLGDVMGGIFFLIPQYIYFFLAVVNFTYALGNKPEKSKTTYVAIVGFYALMMTLIIGCMIWQLGHAWATYSFVQQALVVLSGASYFLAGLLHGELHHLASSFLQYMLLLPTLVNVLQIYSWCNTHDLSWGTKGIDTVHAVPGALMGEARRSAEQRKIEADKKQAAVVMAREDFRCHLLVAWVATNALLVGVIVSEFEDQLLKAAKGTDDSDDTRSLVATYTLVIFYVAACVNALRLIGSFAFLSYKYYTRAKFPKNLPPSRSNYQQPATVHGAVAQVVGAPSFGTTTLNARQTAHTPQENLRTGLLSE